MIISKHKDTYYIKRKNVSEEHNSSCKFDGTYLKNLKAWDFRKNGSIYVSMKNKVYRINAHKNPRIVEKIDFDTFVEYWLKYTWENISKKFIINNKYSVKIEDFFCNLLECSNSIKFEERISVKDLYTYNRLKVYKLNNNGLRGIVVLKFLKKEKLDKKQYMIILEDLLNEKQIKIICDSEKWNESYKKVNVKNSNLIVVGLIECRDSENLEFKEVSIKTISKEGCVINNEYEKRIINDLHKKNRVFIQSFNYYSEFKFYRPSILLIDVTPNIIIEIFDTDRTNVKYYNEKQIKLSYFNNINKYKIMIWDGFKKEKLFKFTKK